MTENQETEDEDAPRKRSKLPLLVGLVIALTGGGGAFFAIYSGMLFGHVAEGPAVAEGHGPSVEAPDVAFVEVDPLVIGIGRGATERHLRFRAQLEVPTPASGDVRKLLPRVVDVMNTYLRAVELADLEDPAALVRLRAQLLRRVQVVTGPGQVNDLLIMEFVVS